MWIKPKAIFMTIILVCSIFSISLLNVKDVKAANNICCEKTIEGDYCMFADESECDSDFMKASTACESTDFCRIGCCYSVDDGVCSKNSEKAECTYNGGTFNENSECEIPQCSKGCCMLPSQCSFVTQTRCKMEVSNFENLAFEDIFKADINNEADCIDQCRSSEEGCCVYTDGAKFTTRDDCVTLDGTFNLNMLCSHESLGTQCTKQHHTGCLEDKDEVYWFDSCGNRENIYESDLAHSYNNGFILAKENSCVLNLADGIDVDCGNCDYTDSSLCSQASDEFLQNLPSDLEGKVQNMCRDLTCKSADLYKPNTIAFGNNYWRLNEDKKSGESWCVYDGITGLGLDLVGSRHYSHVCINGKEVMEECKEKREEICIMNDILMPDNTEITGALCRPNRWQECIQLNEEPECGNVADTGCGYPCQSYKDADKEKEYKDCCKQENCRKDNCQDFIVDCYWNDGFKMCMPNVPIGNTDNCEQGTQECKEVWVKGGTFQKWTCKLNCDCHTAVWAQGANSFCRSLGDCGAHYNIKEDYSLDGFVFTGPDEKVDNNLLQVFGSNQETVDAQEFKKENIGNWNDLDKADEPLTGAEDAIFSAWSLSVKWSMYGPDYPKDYLIHGVSPFGALGITMTGIAVASWIGGLGFTQGLMEAATLTFAGHGGLIGGFGALGSGLNVGAGAIIPAGVEYKATTASVLKVFTGGGTKSSTLLAGESYTVPVGSSAEVIGPSSTGTTSAPVSGGGTVAGTLATIIIIVAITALILYFVHTLGYDQKTITYKATCQPWVALTGGDKCEECVEEFKICDEYRCKSLGQSCELLNANTGNETCVAVNVNDASAPVIDLLPISPRIESDYETINEGYKIKEDIDAYTPVTIGVKTNEPAQCKISKNPSLEYEQMTDYFGSSLSVYDHTMTINVAFEEVNENSLAISGGGAYTYYVRCQDHNGNKNRASYYIQFNVNDEPDLQPPVIEYYSLDPGTYIKYNANETDLIIQLNEPATCKYSKQDKGYEEMEYFFNDENECNIYSSSNPYRYPCPVTLEGINNNADNYFYFKCKDISNNFNTEPQPENGFLLKGSLPLDITAQEPSGTLYNTNVTLEINTENGAEEGKSECYFSEDPITNIGDAVKFFETGETIHEQNLVLGPDIYLYYILCQDIAGNQALTNITFTVDTTNLTISDVLPANNSVIYLDNTLLQVTTEGGNNNNGDCNCYYNNNLIVNKQTSSSQTVHTKNLTGLVNGIYNYDILCNDEYKQDSYYLRFNVDLESVPQLMQIYTTSNMLNIVLDQEVICEYSSQTFTFGQGTRMIPASEYSINKQAALNQDIYYIVCENEYERESSFVVYP